MDENMTEIIVGHVLIHNGIITDKSVKGFSRKIYLGDTELNRIFFIVVVGVQTVSVSLVVGVVDISISWVVGLIPRWIYFWWVS